MNLANLLFVISLIPGLSGQGHAERPVQVPVPAVDRAYGKLPLSFEQNEGQFDPNVVFASRGAGYSVALTSSNAVLSLAGSKYADPSSKQKQSKSAIFKLDLVGLAPGIHVAGDCELPGKANYLIGNDPATWHTSIPTYAKVKYTGVYPGVDLVYYGNQKQLEYDFIVGPYANARSIRMRFSGASRLSVSKGGDLILEAPGGLIAFRKPTIYQVQGDHRQAVPGRFKVMARNIVGFSLGSYDHRKQLVIDPTLAYSTYLGGSSADTVNAVAVDREGNTYMTGGASSVNFPVTPGAFQGTYSGPGFSLTNAFVTKMNADGSALLYSTYLGGDIQDVGNGIAVDEAGNAYITGSSLLKGFPTTSGAFQAQPRSNYSNAFVAKINPKGTGLIYSTYLSGSRILIEGNIILDAGNAIALDKQGNAYVTGIANSTDFPTTANALQKINKAAGNSGSNTFIAVVNPQGSGLKFSTYLGGSGLPPEPQELGVPFGDVANGIAVDSAGKMFITGYTYSFDFPVSRDAFQKINNAVAVQQTNAFVSKIDPETGTLDYSTYLGGRGQRTGGGSQLVSVISDSGAGIAVDLWGHAYVAGQTDSNDFPLTPNAFQKVNGAAAISAPNAFVAKLNTDGSSLIYSTYFGGSGGVSQIGFTGAPVGDQAKGIAIDRAGYIYIAGDAYSFDLPVTGDGFQKKNAAEKGFGLDNAFVAKLDPFHSTLIYSSYLGGTGLVNNAGAAGGDMANAIAVDRQGSAYIVGRTLSPDFHVSRTAFQKVNNEDPTGELISNGFAAKFALGPNPEATPTKTTLVSDHPIQMEGKEVTFTATVTSSSKGDVPEGLIVGTLDDSPPIVVKLDDSGSAVYSTRSLPPGVFTITVNYPGDGVNAESFAILTQTIYSKASTVQAVSGSGQKTLLGAPFPSPLVVHVTDAGGAAVPGVVVSFSGSGLAFSDVTATTDKNGDAAVLATPRRAGNLTASGSAKGANSAAEFALKCVTN